MKVAVVGLGYWGPNIVRNLHSLDACTRVVACDLDEARVKAVLRQYPSVVGTTDVDDVLADRDVCAVVLATPVRTHAGLAEAALRAGKGVLVEKPLATSARDARKLVDLAGELGLLVMAAHTFLYSPPVLTVRDVLAREEIGRLLYLQASRVNLGIHQSDVSVLWDLGPHDVSILLEWLGEEPCRVSASGRSSLSVGPPDVAFVDVEFPSGFVANLHLSWLAPTKMRRMTIVGSRKMIVYEDTHPDEPVKIYDKGVKPPDPGDFGEYRLTYRTGDVVSPRVEASEPLRNQLADFLGRVMRGERPDDREEAAVQVVRVVEGAERSLAANGTPVTL
ncbi:MAG TPA: Gfo/Idh/MocA family oxidoreductase [Acidimicrobiales bacterium]|nr:Gfo/Idh/MocA family oxidoreductase [Acidimicrobiales bacterium]